MFRRPLALGLVTALTAGLAFGFAGTFSSFLGAPAGVPIQVQPISLPTVTPALSPSLSPKSPFAPSFNDLVTGNTVIENPRQWRAVWKTLFDAPFTPGIVDFTQDYVVMMGGGLLDIASFNLTSVEEVDADWTSLFFGSQPDRFIAVTGTTTLPGVFPPDPPPLTYRVSAVRVPRAFIDDVVFHRNVIALP